MNKRAILLPLLAAGLVALVGLAAACGDDNGEDRPGVEVIDEGGGSVSGSGSGTASGVSGSGSGSGTGVSSGSEGYTPVSDVEAHAALALDLADARELMASAADGGAVDWQAVLAIYTEGGNSLRGDGTARTFQSLATDEAVLAQFPDGPSVYGSPSFLDDHVIAGLEGTGRGAGLSDNARRQLVDKGLQVILYGKVLQELEAARAKIEEGNTADSDGAQHNVDEAWAFYVGAAEADGRRPHSLSNTARSREENFGQEGKVDTPLQEALAEALEAARAGDIGGFDDAAADVRGYLNTVFYLATLRYSAEAAGDTDPAEREAHLAEGWAFSRSILAIVGAASDDAAATIDIVYSAAAAEAVPAGATDEVYAALNSAAVLEALGIDDEIVITEPPE